MTGVYKKPVGAVTWWQARNIQNRRTFVIEKQESTAVCILVADSGGNVKTHRDAREGK